jgi:hypothetical protein
MRRRSTPLRCLPYLLVALLVLTSIALALVDDTNTQRDSVESKQRVSEKKVDHAPVCDTKQPVPDECGLVLAPSSLPNAGWGIFSLRDRLRGTPLLAGDVVIQLTDPNVTHAQNIHRMLHDYLWSAEETGGFYEGRVVVSLLPGPGMLANGLDGNRHNVIPFVPAVDEGGCTRLDSPGAGAFTHYHNYTFFVQKPITAGNEVFIDYSADWLKERKQNFVQPETTVDLRRDLDWLRDHGKCLDNLKGGRSPIPHAGRGAFAARPLTKGSIVAPVPVLPIAKREAMDMTSTKTYNNVIAKKQLLLNYCLGHPKSSLLFLPYGPMVNLVNHGGKKANVKLQWSSSQLLINSKNQSEMTLEDVWAMEQSGLLLELIAIRDIASDEEVLMDYGDAWAEAWAEHLLSWKPLPGSETYAPSYVQDDAIKSLRLDSELKLHPYPNNVLTSCLYRYTGNVGKLEAPTATSKTDVVATVQWNMTKGLFQPINLRPCRVLERRHDKRKGTLFTVQIHNRFGLPESQRIPKGIVHVVTDLPRRAIRFSDKIFTTDQHLENAFRHEIGIPEEIFPLKWMDFAKEDKSVLPEF